MREIQNSEGGLLHAYPSPWKHLYLWKETFPIMNLSNIHSLSCTLSQRYSPDINNLQKSTGGLSFDSLHFVNLKTYF